LSRRCFCCIRQQQPLQETRVPTFPSTVWAPRVLSVLRIVAALMFMEHGLGKLFGFPIWPAGGAPVAFKLLWFAGIIEALGGLLLALGLFTRPVALIMSGEMAVGYWMAHAPKSFFPLVNGGDAAVLYCFVFFYIFVAGAGAWSVDRARGG
jgi:putative oxidoreductase